MVDKIKRFRKEFVIEYDMVYPDSKAETSSWLCKENLQLMINQSRSLNGIKVVHEVDVGIVPENEEIRYEGEYCPRCGKEYHPVETYGLGFCYSCLGMNVREYINELENKKRTTGPNSFPIYYRHNENKPIGHISLTKESVDIIREATGISRIYSASMMEDGDISFTGLVSK